MRLGLWLWLLAVEGLACQGPPAEGEAAPAASVPERTGVHWSLLPGREPEERAGAFEEVEQRGDGRFLAPLVDLLRFARTREEWFRVLDAVSAITDIDARTLNMPWRELTLRLASMEDPQLPDGYAAWKGELLAQQVDPRYTEFLYGGVASRVGLEEVVWGGVGVDGIPSLVDPKAVPAPAADFLQSDDPVFGVEIGGQARAYPLRILDWHEMANDVLGGVPIALAYCTLCGAGIVYDRRVGERTMEFGTSGLLMRSNKLMFDRGTKSLWNQMTGEPVIGSLANSGLALEALAVVVTTWDEWRARHPATSVVSPATGFDRDYTLGAAYGDYFASEGLMFPVPESDGRSDAASLETAQGKSGGPGPDGRPRDERPRDKQRVFVLRTANGACAFSLAASRGRVRNERCAGLDVVLVDSRAAAERALPTDWTEWLESSEGRGSAPRSFSELDWPTLEAVIEAKRERLDDLTNSRLLALGDDTRRALFASGWIDAGVRDAVATKALVGGIRAYRAGGRQFRAAVEAGVLVDQSGRRWRVTERALRALPGEGAADEDSSGEDSAGEELARLPGHASFGLGWNAFFPGGTYRR